MNWRNQKRLGQNVFSCGCVTAAAVAACAFLPFVPLIIAAFEYFILGTEHFEDLLRTTPIYDPLRLLYKPFLDGLRLIFNF